MSEAPVRRIREDNEKQAEKEPVPFSEAVIAESDETTWVLVGDTWVDSARIISVGPIENVYAGEQDSEFPPTEPEIEAWKKKVGVLPDAGVAVQIDAPHPESQFVLSFTDTVEEIMGRVIDAQTEDDEDDK